MQPKKKVAFNTVALSTYSSTLSHILWSVCVVVPHANCSDEGLNSSEASLFGPNTFVPVTVAFLNTITRSQHLFSSPLVVIS